MGSFTQYSVLTLRQLINLYWRVEAGCDKACGCGHCGLDFLAEYTIDDTGATEKCEAMEL